MKRATFALMTLALLAACSTMDVQTDYWEEADFTKFQTFRYSESTTTVAVTAPLADQRIVSAIRQAMTTSGFTEVEDDADMIVTYYGSTSEGLRFTTTYTGMSGWALARGMTTGTATTTATTYQEGTLVIDIWESSENQLLWRSTITHTLSENPDRNADRIDRAVSRALSEFPPD